MPKSALRPGIQESKNQFLDGLGLADWASKGRGGRGSGPTSTPTPSATASATTARQVLQRPRQGTPPFFLERHRRRPPTRVLGPSPGLVCHRRRLAWTFRPLFQERPSPAYRRAHPQPFIPPYSPNAFLRFYGCVLGLSIGKPLEPPSTGSGSSTAQVGVLRLATTAPPTPSATASAFLPTGYHVRRILDDGLGLDGQRTGYAPPVQESKNPKTNSWTASPTGPARGGENAGAARPRRRPHRRRPPTRVLGPLSSLARNRCRLAWTFGPGTSRHIYPTPLPATPSASSRPATTSAAQAVPGSRLLRPRLGSLQSFPPTSPTRFHDRLCPLRAAHETRLGLAAADKPRRFASVGHNPGLVAANGRLRHVAKQIIYFASNIRNPINGPPFRG